MEFDNKNNIYTPKLGFLTLKYKNDFLKKKNNDNSYNKICLVASNNKKEPLYFWQLYSILGYDNIFLIIKTFYTNIFNENNIKKIWFKKKFEESGPINYHIKGQLKFWLDLMGGGPYYEREKKVNLYHKLVKEIMNKKGADMWIYYMDMTLKKLYENIDFNYDERIIPCIYDFIYFFMKKYADEFSFSFNSKSKL